MNFPNEIKAIFSRDIVLGVGFLRVYKDNVLFLTFTENDISVTDNYFTIDVTNLFPDNGNYFITFTQGLIKSVFNEDIFISDSETWKFTIGDAEYDSEDYNNEYLI
jgi:hypothetical protein